MAEVPQRSDPPAVLAALNATLLRHASATLALERWCRAHGAPPGAAIVARHWPGPVAPTTPARRRRLEVDPVELVRHRRVRLCCHERVLAEAENWYVPGRLSAAMNLALEASETPFGRAADGLRFARRVLAVDLLWVDPAAPPPPCVLRHRALLIRDDGAPISEVVETYRRESLFLASEPW